MFWIISFLLEFLTTERDWKFLLILMFNNRKCSLDIVEVHLAEAYFNENSYWLKAIKCFCKRFHLRCLTGFRILFGNKIYFDYKILLKVSWKLRTFNKFSIYCLKLFNIRFDEDAIVVSVFLFQIVELLCQYLIVGASKCLS